MASVTTDQRLGVNASKAIKVPCRACSYGANITLSGEQTIDGIAIVSGDRVLVAGQTDGSENGIYDANTGTWTRSPDWDGANDVGPGTRVYVYSGTNYTGTWIVGNTSAITIGTTSVTLSAYTIDNLGRVFSTVALAKAATDLVNGQLVFITGYYATNDGGGGAYRYDSSSSDTANNGTIIALDTLAGRLVHTGHTVISVKTFGAVGDGVTDDTAAIQAAVDALSAGGGGDLILPAGIYAISESLVIPWRVNLIGAAGDGSTIKPLASFIGTQNYAVLLNSTNGSSWAVASVGVATGFVRNVDIDGVDSPATTKGFFSAGSYLFEDIKANNLANHVTSSGVDYTDQVTIRRAHSRLPTGSGYQYSMGLLGDGLRLEQVHLGNSVTAYKNNIEVIGSSGGSIRDCIGGTIRLDRCDGFSITSFHSEGFAQLLLQDSTCAIKDSFIFADLVKTIIMTNPGGSMNHVTLDNVTFVYPLAASGATFDDCDIQLSNFTSVSIRNCHKRSFEVGGIATSELYGIKVYDSTGSPLDDFNNYSHILSHDGFIDLEQKVRKLGMHIDTGVGNASLLGTSAVSGKVVWDKASGTYYYNASFVFDPVRLIGQGNSASEIALSLTSGGNGAGLRILGTGGTRPRNSIVRVYRGTATNSYDEYVDLPMMAAQYAYDKGTNIAGYAWKARTAGTFDSFANVQSLDISSTNLKGQAASLVTRGSFIVNDYLENTGTSSYIPDVNNMVLKGWRRMTTGAAHVLNTDWLPLYESTVSPAT